MANPKSRYQLRSRVSKKFSNLNQQPNLQWLLSAKCAELTQEQIRERNSIQPISIEKMWITRETKQIKLVAILETTSQARLAMAKLHSSKKNGVNHNDSDEKNAKATFEIFDFLNKYRINGISCLQKYIQDHELSNKLHVLLALFLNENWVQPDYVCAVFLAIVLFFVVGSSLHFFILC